VAKDAPLELLQRRAGLDSELLHERRSSRPIGVECVLLTARAVEREDVLLAETLAVRIVADETLERGNELDLAAERELGVGEELACPQPALLEPARLRFRQRLARQVGEWRAAPQLERCSEVGGGVVCLSGRELVAAASNEALEALQVELAGLESEPVAPAAGLDPVRPERAAQPVDVDLERLHRRLGRLTGPERVHEAVPGDGFVGPEQERRQQRPLLGRAEGKPVPLLECLHRTEDPKLSDANDPLNSSPSRS
jgi:hypothetical protein